MAVLEELQQAVEKVAGAVAPSVVRIGRGPGRGGGVVVGHGAVLTNAHNLRGSETTVSFADGRAEVGSAAGVDLDSDLAVVRVATAGATALDWHDGEARIGESVFAVTSPAGAGVRVTFGTVSSSGRPFRGPRGRLVPGGLEHTAPLARGSSGSPLVDEEGRLVGINTHRLGDGFYLAIPADAQLRARVDALARGESPRRRYLGLALLPPPAARRLRAAV
ncbi:MAG: S1C family serine protease, partial [Nitrososphaerales archaeon]